MLPLRLRSSEGFHTMTLSVPALVFESEREKLISGFKRYGRELDAVQIYTNKQKNIVIKFYRHDMGIQWLIRPDVYLESYRTTIDIIDVTINPKILGGVHDYITAATYDDMDAAITNFNSISQHISPLLGTFKDYSLKRIDYLGRLPGV